MFRKANLRLTFFFSVLFLLSFWVFSVGLYFWMDNSFGKSFINQVQESTLSQNSTLYDAYGFNNDPEITSGGNLGQSGTTIVTIAGDVALERLRNILLILNGALVIIIPAVAWILLPFSKRMMEISRMSSGV